MDKYKILPNKKIIFFLNKIITKSGMNWFFWNAKFPIGVLFYYIKDYYINSYNVDKWVNKNRTSLRVWEALKYKI